MNEKRGRDRQEEEKDMTDQLSRSWRSREQKELRR